MIIAACTKINEFVFQCRFSMNACSVLTYTALPHSSYLQLIILRALINIPKISPSYQQQRFLLILERDHFPYNRTIESLKNDIF